MSISDLRDALREQLVEFAWSQWTQMGLSGHVSRLDRWVMDPEALILFTAEVARREPRLFDELMDWMCLNNGFLSLQRLRNLARGFPLESNLIDAVVEWVSESATSVRWPARSSRTDNVEGGLVALFDSSVLSYVDTPEPIFARHGYLRQTLSRSGKSAEPNIGDPINFALQLRLLFGPGTRSEIIRILLTRDDGPLDAAQIADEAGFAKRNINEALKALAASRAVKARRKGNQRVYLVSRDKWSTLLEVGPKGDRLPKAVSWVHLLPALVRVLLWLEQEADIEGSDYMASSRARDLTEQIAPDLEAVGVEFPPPASAAGVSYLAAFEQMIKSLTALLAPLK